MNHDSDRSDRSVSIGGDATGNVIQTGDGNQASLRLTQVRLPPPESVNIEDELSAIREALQQLRSENSGKIERAIEDARDELRKPEPDRDEVGGAVARALEYAKAADGFASTAVNIKEHVTSVVSWLGEHWHKLLPVVGLTL